MLNPHPSRAGLPIAKSFDFANPESDGADTVWYATLVQGLTAANPTAQSTLQIDQAVDFYWYATTLQGDNEGAPVTESSVVLPMVNVVIQDNASQKNLENITLPVGSLAGWGERPYRLIEPRRILAGATMSFSWKAIVGGGVIYTNLYLVLHGYTLPSAGPPVRRTPRSLIANEGYEVAWTRADKFFNQPLPDINGAPAQPINQNPTNEFPWVCRGYPLVIPPNVNVSTPLLLEDNYRSLIILQNNSFATAPDVGATLFISLDGPVNFTVIGGVSVPLNAIQLVPQEGLVLDTRVLGNALYFAWGFGGNSAVNYGMCIYGRSLNSPPLPAWANTPVQRATEAPRARYVNYSGGR